MELQRLYFFTTTILNWHKLLQSDEYKEIIVRCLGYLVNSEKIKVYSFVIMPNHIHLIWELLELNGKEMPHASLIKFTSHCIQKDLRKNHPKILKLFNVNTETREYQFWQRDSLPIQLYTPNVIFQKLDYIHNNPCKGKWMLAPSPIDYRYSSAKFYESGVDDFGFLTHIGERL